MNNKKRYTIIDDKKSIIKKYNSFAWNASWMLVFIIGVVLGATIF